MTLKTAQSEKEHLKDQMNSEVEEKNNLINSMRDESNKLQTKMTVGLLTFTLYQISIVFLYVPLLLYITDIFTPLS